MNKQLSEILGNIFLVISIILSIFLLLTGTQDKKQYGEGSGYIAFVLDVSQSMNIRDVDRTSRLESAKQKIYSIISQNQAYNYALNIFAGESMRIVPFTHDVSLFSTLLSGLDSNNILKQGTNIDDAFQDAIVSFGEEKTGIIVLLTDGDEENIPISSNIKQTLKDSDVEIYIIGVGSEKGGHIPTGDIFSPYKKYNGENVVAKLNRSGLKKLSGEINAQYYDFDEDIIIDSQTSSQKKQGNTSLIFFIFFFWILYISSISIRLYYDKK